MNNKERVVVLKKVLGLNTKLSNSQQDNLVSRCIGCGSINIGSKDKVKPFCNICLMLGRGYNE